ncbi:hypothetical protein IG631_04744 [Alternaria alternata]|nr:hypothetical protein IG631_04744 [Alternaria alternata]
MPSGSEKQCLVRDKGWIRERWSDNSGQYLVLATSCVLANLDDWSDHATSQTRACRHEMCWHFPIVPGQYKRCNWAAPVDDD